LKKRHTFLRVSGLIIFVYIIFVISVDSLYRPVIMSNIETRSGVMALNIVNEAVTRQIKNAKYENMVSVHKTGDGTVTAIESNAAAVNSFKSETTLAITNAFEKNNKKPANISLGTLSGNVFLLGCGPKMKFKFDTANSVNIQLVSSFESVGINQTVHRLYLEVEVSTKVLASWHKTKTTVKTNFLVAETVIVGDVPNTAIEISK